MTRFMMALDDAIDLVLFAFNNGQPGDIFVQKAPAATVGDMTQALCELMGKPNYPTRVIGTRHGEKRYESLLSREEMACAVDMGDYYRIPPDLRDLNYAKYVDLGEESITNADEYNSDNTVRLDVEGMKLLLNKLRFIQAASKGEIIDPEE
jgi:UDP-glucose 4-epimerase